jgi:hypothetical protein
MQSLSVAGTGFGKSFHLFCSLGTENLADQELNGGKSQVGEFGHGMDVLFL